MSTRLTVRNTLDNGWLDQCTSEFYFRDGFNGSWVRFYPEQTSVRDSGNKEWLDVDCAFDEVLDDPCANLALLASLTCPGLIAIEDAGSGNGVGSGGPEFDILEGYPEGYDLPDAGQTGFGVERSLGNFEGKTISRPGLDFAKETYGSEATNSFLGRGTYANPSYLYTHTFSNGTAINETIYEMGDRSGFFEILYGSYHPDGLSIDVYYLGSLIASTCGRVTGRGKLEFVFDPAIGAGENRIMIRVRGEDKHRWTYSVVGPKASLDIPVFEPGNIDMLARIRTSEYVGTPLFPAPTHARVYPFENRLENGQYWYEYTHEVGLLDPAAGPYILHLNYETWENADWVEVYHGGERIATTRGHETEDGLLRIVFDPYRFSTPVPDITVKVMARERILGADILSQEYMLYDANTRGYKEGRWDCETPPGGITSAGHYSTEDHFEMNVLPGDGVASVRIDPTGGSNFVYIASAFDSRGDLITAVQGTGTQFLQWFKFVDDPEHDFRDKISIRIDAPIDSSWNYQVGCYVPLLEIEIDDQTVPACPDIGDIQIAINDATAVEGQQARFTVTTNFPVPEALTLDFRTEDDSASSQPLATQSAEVYPLVRSTAGEVTSVIYDNNDDGYTLIIESDPSRWMVGSGVGGEQPDTIDFSYIDLHNPSRGFYVEQGGEVDRSVSTEAELPTYYRMLVNIFRDRLGSFGPGTRILMLTHQLEVSFGTSTVKKQYNMEVVLDHLTRSLVNIYGVTVDVEYINDYGKNHADTITNQDIFPNHSTIFGNYDVVMIDPGEEWRQHINPNADIASLSDYRAKIFDRGQSTQFATRLAAAVRSTGPKVVVTTAGLYNTGMPSQLFQVPNINAQDIINAFGINDAVSLESHNAAQGTNSNQPISVQNVIDIHGANDIWNGIDTNDRIHVDPIATSFAKFVLDGSAGSSGTQGDGIDYQSRSGTVTIPAGLSSASIAINTYSDSIDDPDEQFRVIISNASSGTIVDDTGIGTITQTNVDVGGSRNDITINRNELYTRAAGLRGAAQAKYPPSVVSIVIGVSDVDLATDSPTDPAVSARPVYTPEPGKIGFVMTDGTATTVSGQSNFNELSVIHGELGEYEFDPARTYEYRWVVRFLSTTPFPPWQQDGEIVGRSVWASANETETIFTGQPETWDANNNILSFQVPDAFYDVSYGGGQTVEVEIFIRDDLGNEQKSSPLPVRFLWTSNTSGGGGGGGGGCVAPDTLVYMADGSTRIAERVQQGEKIKGFYIPGMIDEATPGWEDWTTESIVHGRVVDVTVKTVARDWYRNYWIINNDLKITQEHHIFAKKGSEWGWHDVRDLRIGDKLMRQDGQEINIGTLVFVDERIDVIVFDVEEHDTYFVGRTPVLVHNDPTFNKN
jgi:hypothetical protein